MRNLKQFVQDLRAAAELLNSLASEVEQTQTQFAQLAQLAAAYSGVKPPEAEKRRPFAVSAGLPPLPRKARTLSSEEKAQLKLLWKQSEYNQLPWKDDAAIQMRENLARSFNTTPGRIDQILDPQRAKLAANARKGKKKPLLQLAAPEASAGAAVEGTPKVN